MSNTKMIVGLGNPGPRYQNNRHNIGFRTIELYAERHGIDVARTQMKAITGDGFVQRRIKQAETVPKGRAENGHAYSPLSALGEVTRYKLILVKPMTYMNKSGDAVASLVNFYRINLDDLLVIHDDLDIDTGKIRLRPGGGSGGQNGIKSIITCVGSRDFARLRIGIGRPPGRMAASAYVLQDFLRAEADIFAPLASTLCDAIDAWVFQGIDYAMNRYNR